MWAKALAGDILFIHDLKVVANNFYKSIKYKLVVRVFHIIFKFKNGETFSLIIFYNEIVNAVYINLECETLEENILDVVISILTILI